MSNNQPSRFESSGTRIVDTQEGRYADAMTERGAGTLAREMNAGRIDPDKLRWRELTSD